eukprot:4254147-Prymnesium_polylepis.1
MRLLPRQRQHHRRLRRVAARPEARRAQRYVPLHRQVIRRFQREHEELVPVRLQPHIAFPPEERCILARLWQQHAHILRPRRRCRRAHRLAPRHPLLLR